MIRINDVTVRFGKVTAVDSASLTLEPQDSVALWGANGAGKTTLLRCVLGLHRFRGNIHVDSRDIRRHGKHARLMIGYVPQELGFYDDLGVAEALAFFGRLKGLPPSNALEHLEAVGLTGHHRKRIRELSGGMKQRLALAIALLGDPSILVLDEVTASLDAFGRDEFVSLLKQLSGSGRTMLFASHRVEEVAILAKRVAVMERGRITQILPCQDFISQQGRHAVLHLTIALNARQQAMNSLQSRGFCPQLNGVGLLVPVTPQSKAAPFRVLAESNIPIDDFELVSAIHTPTTPNLPKDAHP